MSAQPMMTALDWVVIAAAAVAAVLLILFAIKQREAHNRERPDPA